MQEQTNMYLMDTMHTYSSNKLCLHAHQVKLYREGRTNCQGHAVGDKAKHSA